MNHTAFGIHLQQYINTPTSMHTHVYLYICAHTHARMHICTHTDMSSHSLKKRANTFPKNWLGTQLFPPGSLSLPHSTSSPEPPAHHSDRKAGCKLPLIQGHTVSMWPGLNCRPRSFEFQSLHTLPTRPTASNVEVFCKQGGKEISVDSVF